MGYEKTPPKNHVIAGLALGSALLLGSLHFVFTSYFSHATTAMQQEQVLGVTVWDGRGVNAQAAARLENGRTPVGMVMRQLAKDGRPAELRPNVDAEEESLDALRGWTAAPAASDAEVEQAKTAHALGLYRKAVQALEVGRGASPKLTKEQLAELEAKVAARKQALEKLGIAVSAVEASEATGAPPADGAPTRTKAPGAMLEVQPAAPAAPEQGKSSSHGATPH